MAVRTSKILKQRTLLVACIAVTIILGMVVIQVWQTYLATTDVARREIEQVSQILEANTNTTFQSAELIIDHAVEDILARIAAPRPRADLVEHFTEIADPWSFVHSVALVDTDGIIRQGVLRQQDGRLHPLNTTVNLSGRQLFVTHRDAHWIGEKALFVTPPGPDMISREVVIAITKGIYDAAGVFKGVCVVTVTPGHFTQVYAGLLPSRHMAVELWNRDGTLLASTTPDRTSNLTSGERRLFDDLIDSSAQGVTRSASLPGVGEQLLSYRTLVDYPVIVAVTASWRQIMGSWRNASFVLALAALIGVLVIGALTAWLLHRIGALQIAQRALMKSEHNLAESQRLSGIAYFELDLATNELTWSDGMYALHGADPKSLTPTDQEAVLNLVVAEDRPKVSDAWRSITDLQRPGNYECRIHLPDGGERHMRYSWKILEDGSGNLTRVFGVAQDMTAIRKAEDRIRNDRQRLRDIVECSSDFIWEVDAAGAVTLFGGAGLDEFSEIIAAAPLTAALPRERTDDGEIGALYKAVQKREKFRNLLMPLNGNAREMRLVRISGNPRFDAQGKFLGFRGAGTDVTELRRKRERVEAGSKAEALGRLASGMAHEINNLLQPIIIYANFGVSRPDLAADVRQYFRRIGRAAERSVLIVKNVLTFARQSPPTREQVHVLDVVQETVDLIGGTLGGDTEVVVNDRAADPVVWVDRSGLAQILTNLLTNAAEALPNGGRISVTIDVADVSTGDAKSLAISQGAYCRLTVEDNGAGIPEDKISKVFDPFFTTKPQGKGTGLGLSVVAGLAKSWGGAATVESTPGLKTSFIIFMPVAEQRLAAAQ